MIDRPLFPRGFQDLGLGALAPLHAALPDLVRVADDGAQGGPRGGPRKRNQRENRASPTGFEARDGDEDAGFSEILTDDDEEAEDSPTSKPADSGEVAQRGPAPDAVEEALAVALERASGAGDWATVRALAGELEARRQARLAVVDLGVERAKRRPM